VTVIIASPPIVIGQFGASQYSASSFNKGAKTYLNAADEPGCPESSSISGISEVRLLDRIFVLVDIRHTVQWRYLLWIYGFLVPFRS